MLEFCGQERCTLDANGRIKLHNNLLRSFKRYSEDEIILHCLPEGAIAAYPPQIWQSMRGQGTNNKAEFVLSSLVYRRNLRRFGAMSQSVSITNQGRITIPTLYREYASLEPNCEIFLIGCEVGIEIWKSDQWLREAKIMQQHSIDKGEHEMNIDLLKEGDL